jgi:hypothetical protein
MDGGQVTAIVIVAIVMVGAVLKSIFRGPRHPVVFNNDGQARIENQRLREEVTELKERIKVLERITVEKENSLAKEIESLRDR